MSPQHLPRATLQFPSTLPLVPKVMARATIVLRTFLLDDLLTRLGQRRCRYARRVNPFSPLVVLLTPLKNVQPWADFRPFRSSARQRQDEWTRFLSYSSQPIRGAQTHWYTALGTSRLTLSRKEKNSTISFTRDS